VHAGVTWTNRTTGALWAARDGHTSVVDAAGAIYVIGGVGSGDNLYQDVWVSTDGGADRSRRHSGVLEGVLRGYYRVLMGYLMVLRGTNGDTDGCYGVLMRTKGFYMSIAGVLLGVLRGH
jgi:hypothetical protein